MERNQLHLSTLVSLCVQRQDTFGRTDIRVRKEARADGDLGRRRDLINDLIICREQMIALAELSWVIKKRNL